MSDAKNGGWKPHSSYKCSLQAIQFQSTPSDIYRNHLKSISRDNRSVKRLQFFIQLTHEKCHRAGWCLHHCILLLKLLCIDYSLRTVY